MRSIAVFTLLLLAQAAPIATPSAGVLVGVHRLHDFMMDRPGAPPPAAGDLRTIWLPITRGASVSTPIELGDLLLPRRSGFWQLGLLGTCAEEPHLDADDKPRGTETYVSDYLWAVPAGRQPRMAADAVRSEPDEVVGPCTSRDVHCAADGRTTLFWVWPEYVSLNRGRETGCGVHPDASFEYSVSTIDALHTRLTIGDVLGAPIERRFERAFRTAAREAQAVTDCGEPAAFQPDSWHVERQPGGWKAEGWSDTHRLCGYGVDFTSGVDLSKMTGRKDDRARWQRLSAKMPALSDAHFSPDGRWVLATMENELLLFASATPDTPLSRLPLSKYDDSVVMVEWAVGPHAARWDAEVRRLSRLPRMQPLVR